MDVGRIKTQSVMNKGGSALDDSKKEAGGCNDVK
jgi:hypothetical protein